MIIIPRLKAGVTAQWVGDDAVFFLTEEGRHVRLGTVPFRLAQLIDGRTSTDAIVEELRPEASLEHIYFHLLNLQAGELIEEAVAATASSPGAALEPRAGEVSCSGSPEPAVAGIVEILNREGASVVDDCAAHVALVVVEDYLDPGLSELNAARLRSGGRWMLAKTAGTSLWLGPLFVPGETGCWECLAQRLRSHRPVDAFLAEMGRDPGAVNAPAPPAVAEAFQALAADRLIRAAAGDTELLGRVITIEAGSLESRRHELARLDHCPACGEAAAARAPSPIDLVDRPVREGSGGGLRVATAEETLERVAPLISPITGIVRAVHRAEGAEGLPPTYNLPHIFQRRGEGLDGLVQTLSHNASGGKGRTDVDAKVSGICEAVERYSGVFRGDEIMERAKFADIADRALEPLSLMQISDSQYADRDSINARFDRRQLIPARLDPETEISWTPAWSLRDRRHVWAPTAYLYYGFPGLDRRFLYADSNGCASGNTIEEAILQGFFEVAERDAVAIWWYNRLRRPAVDLASFRDPFVDSVRARYRELGREIWAIDLTNDLGIPVFAALSRAVEGAEDIIFGFGAHLDAGLALSRAVSELHQCLPCVWPRQQEAGMEYRYPSTDAKRWWREARIEAHSYLLPDGAQAARVASDFRPFACSNLRQAVEHCVGIVAGAGLDFIVLDQSRSDAILPVAKVIVPELRHFWTRLREGRLYEVPVAMGWQPAATPEAELNPWPMFL